uniref:Uncharacterized protein n=1 Tax=Anguilla anguilla TaxID=7936 RepID=A0A0E9PET4_ANGAN
MDVTHGFYFFFPLCLAPLI